ncbi:MAG: putative integral membrane protein [Saprospiraceae bacterium]|jgi:uncharacterized integral membrane protein
MSLLNKYFKNIALTLLLCMMSMISVAQNPNDVEMADVMRDNGKIYVVVAVLSIILGGLFVYLISLNMKISKLEKELK